MEQTSKPTAINPEGAVSTGRSVPVFLVTATSAMLAFMTGWGAAGVVVGLLMAFAITEGFARRFPGGIRLRWVFRPNLLSVAVVAGFLLLFVYLLPSNVACIEGGKVVGFSLPVLVQCNGPGGTPGEPEFSLINLAFDGFISFVLGTLVAGLVRPRKPFFRHLA